MKIKRKKISVCLNGFEKYLLNEGLNKVLEGMVTEIAETIDNGKQPIMTIGFASGIIGELKEKLEIESGS